MWIKLIIFRMIPVAGFIFCRNYQKKKRYSLWLGAVIFTSFTLSLLYFYEKKQLLGMGIFLLALLPQWLAYGFALFLIYRCIWQCWSVRVWDRIYKIALIFLIFGMILEKYCNPWVISWLK